MSSAWASLIVSTAGGLFNPLSSLLKRHWHSRPPRTSRRSSFSVLMFSVAQSYLLLSINRRIISPKASPFVENFLITFKVLPDKPHTIDSHCDFTPPERTISATFSMFAPNIYPFEFHLRPREKHTSSFSLHHLRRKSNGIRSTLVERAKKPSSTATR